MPTYNPEALKRGIEHSKKNIAVLKEAIQKERATIKSYETMIRDLAIQKERIAARDKFAKDVEKQIAEPINDYPN